MDVSSDGTLSQDAILSWPILANRGADQLLHTVAMVTNERRSPRLFGR